MDVDDAPAYLLREELRGHGAAVRSLCYCSTGTLVSGGADAVVNRWEVRESGGGTYQCGGHTAHDPAVDFDDFAMDQAFWEDRVWPVLAHRIPQFEAIRVQSEWAGHYAMNAFDHNAIIGPHHDVQNFFFLNGFPDTACSNRPPWGVARQKS